MDGIWELGVECASRRYPVWTYYEGIYNVWSFLFRWDTQCLVIVSVEYSMDEWFLRGTMYRAVLMGMFSREDLCGRVLWYGSQGWFSWTVLKDGFHGRFSGIVVKDSFHGSFSRILSTGNSTNRAFSPPIFATNSK